MHGGQKYHIATTSGSSVVSSYHCKNRRSDVSGGIFSNQKNRVFRTKIACTGCRRHNRRRRRIVAIHLIILQALEVRLIFPLRRSPDLGLFASFPGARGCAALVSLPPKLEILGVQDF